MAKALYDRSILGKGSSLLTNCHSSKKVKTEPLSNAIEMSRVFFFVECLPSAFEIARRQYVDTAAYDFFTYINCKEKEDP